MRQLNAFQSLTSQRLDRVGDAELTLQGVSPLPELVPLLYFLQRVVVVQLLLQHLLVDGTACMRWATLFIFSPCTACRVRTTRAHLLE